MSKITLTDLVNLENQTSAVNAINTNSSTLEAAVENTLSRDGESPNQMEALLDMNSNQIINLPYPGSDTSPIRLTDLVEFTPVTTITALTGTSGHTVPFNDGNNIFSGNLTLSGTNAVTGSLSVPFTQSGTGAVARTLDSKAKDTVDTRDFGVIDDPTGLVDQRAALQAAIDATPLYGTLLIQPTTHPIMVGPSGSGYCLRIDQRPINIQGDGKNGWLGQLASVNNTDDFIRIVPYAGGIWESFSMRNLFIGNSNGLRRGKSAIVVDTTTNAAALLTGAVFENIYTFDSVAGHNLGASFTHLNTSIANPNGGMVCTTIRNCILLGGLSFQATGDHNCVERCQIAGAYAGIAVTMVNGTSGRSANFGLIRNNITLPGGTIIDSGTKVTIQGNTFEQTVLSTEPNNAVLDITGGSYQVDVINILDNNIGVTAGLTTIPIRLVNVKNATVDLNRIGVPTAYSSIYIDAVADRPRVTRRNSITFFTASPIDNRIPLTSATGLQHEFYQSVRSVGDTGPVVILIDDVTVALAAGLSADRTWFLPDATKMWPGQRITVLDCAQGLTAHSIILTCTGTNTFQDGSTGYVMSTAGMKVVAEAYPSLNQWHVTKSVK